MRNGKTTSSDNNRLSGTRTVEYIPIDCSTYARYELAVLKGQALRIAWVGRRNQHHVETLFPTDLRTRWHSEFMIAHNCLGQQRVLRLDRIRRAQIIES
jgi:transcriptional antiterminator Rof (Rho-off)